MPKSKIILIVLVCVVVLAVIGFGIYSAVTTVDFGEITLASVPEKSENATRVMSFNVRCVSDPEGSVKNRSKIVTEIIKQYMPDSFGVQEARLQWLGILDRKLGDKYARVGVARDAFFLFSEYNCVYYLKDKYNLIDSGTYWLSETPYEKYSVSFDSACRRIATWAVLENKETGERYTHINTHLDHVLESTRVGQCGVLLSEMSKLETQGSVVCTGDFNTYSDGEVYAAMTKDSDDAAAVAKNTDSGITYHNYGKIAEDGQGAIDFIFLSKGTEVDTYKVIRDTAKGMYPSDHYPIVADIYI